MHVDKPVTKDDISKLAEPVLSVGLVVVEHDSVTADIAIASRKQASKITGFFCRLKHIEYSIVKYPKTALYDAIIICYFRKYNFIYRAAVISSQGSINCTSRKYIHS